MQTKSFYQEIKFRNHSLSRNRMIQKALQCIIIIVGALLAGWGTFLLLTYLTK